MQQIAIKVFEETFANLRPKLPYLPQKECSFRIRTFEICMYLILFFFWQNHWFSCFFHNSVYISIYLIHPSKISLVAIVSNQIQNVALMCPTLCTRSISPKSKHWKCFFNICKAVIAQCCQKLDITLVDKDPVQLVNIYKGC